MAGAAEAAPPPGIRSSSVNRLLGQKTRTAQKRAAVEARHEIGVEDVGDPAEQIVVQLACVGEVVVPPVRGDDDVRARAHGCLDGAELGGIEDGAALVELEVAVRDRHLSAPSRVQGVT